MKAFIAREFVWLLATLVLAFPLAFIWLSAVDLVSPAPAYSPDEKVFVTELFVIAYAVCFIGVYLFRLVMMAIKQVAIPA
ncbi:hypothetical protein CLV84_1043 [Neolewinella xylanilytica]|uniref:Uncharacterized protein n=1 Tax=Neolewinella xylanilytica TaxID=1514080 RepID=A0A2S6I9A3_9BACT|nr:hypothetical protein [Neolewinella xylanilytica]PPK88080.1 hypothetical protein CLV84_1043 [Neolewinella xylanilytica]